ncbi:MAG: inorganic phosphate transporter, partial [Planctomycetota bacterium]
MLHLLGSLFLGWSLGTNHAANVFGTAVTSRMVRYSTAVALASVFVVLGAALEGHAGIATVSRLSTHDAATATIIVVATGLAMALMTWLRIPSSTSQALVGALIGVGIATSSLHPEELPKVVICWLATPLGALLAAAVFYRLAGWALNAWDPSLYAHDVLMRAGLIVVGCYGAYALGANNVANVTGVYVSAGLLDESRALL